MNKSFKSFWSKSQKVKACRLELFLEINKRTCTFIRKTRVPNITLIIGKPNLRYKSVLTKNSRKSGFNCVMETFPRLKEYLVPLAAIIDLNDLSSKLCDFTLLMSCCREALKWAQISSKTGTFYFVYKTSEKKIIRIHFGGKICF